MFTRQLRFALIVIAVFAVIVSSSSEARSAVVTRYQFEGDLLDNAPAGGTADDLTPVANSGPLNVGFVPGVPGVPGQAVRISRDPGDAAILFAPSSADLNLAANFTIESFVQPTFDDGQEWDRFATKWFDGSNNWHWAFRNQGAVTNGQDYFQNGGQIINSSTTIPVPHNEWTHVAVTGDGASIVLWQNGVPVGSAAYVAPNAGGDNFRLGNRDAVADGALQFYGLVDEFMIHDVAQDANYMLGRAALLNAPPTSAVPEPSALAMIFIAGFGFAALFWRRRV